MNSRWWAGETFPLLVHRLLGGQISIVDDTLLQKLLTHLECLHLSSDDTGQLISMLDLAKMIPLMSSDEIDPDALAFGLKLIGLLSLAEMQLLLESGENLIQNVVNDWCHRACVKECPATVRSAGLQMLHAFSSHPLGLRDLITADAVHIALACLADDSLFVCSDAQKFVSAFITKALIQDDKKTDSYTTATSTLDSLVSKLASHKNCWVGRRVDLGNKMLLSVLTVLKEVCQHTHVTTLCPELKIHLMTLLRKFSDDKQLALKVCHVLVAIMWNSGEADMTVKEVTAILLKNSEMTVVQTFATMVLARSASEPLAHSVSENLQSLILLPLELNIKKQERTLKDLCSSISLLCRHHNKIHKKNLQMQTLSWLCSILEDAPKYLMGFGSSKLQMAALNCIHTLVRSWPSNKDILTLLAKAIFNVLESNGSSPMVLISATQVIALVTNNLVQQAEGTIHDISWLLKKLSKDIHDLLLRDSWELKDSALELIAAVAPTILASENSSWITEEDFPSTVLQCLQDEESFVRASALSTLGVLSNSESTWRSLVDLKSEEEVVNEVLLALRNDTEAVVRRSAVKVISKWYLDKVVSHRFLNKKICHALHLASGDLDWEVKLSVLYFWDEISLQILPNFRASQCHNEVPAYASFLMEEETKNQCHTMLSKDDLWAALQLLNKLGFCQTLMNVADDYDVSVKLQASLMLHRLKMYLADSGLVNGVSADNGQVEDVFNDCEIHCRKRRKATMSEVPTTTDGEPTDILAECDSEHNACNDVTNGYEYGKALNKPTPCVNLNNFLKLLQSDLDSTITECQKTTDIYEENIEMLLKDILANTADGETNAIDCY